LGLPKSVKKKQKLFFFPAVSFVLLFQMQRPVYFGQQQQFIQQRQLQQVGTIVAPFQNAKLSPNHYVPISGSSTKIQEQIDEENTEDQQEELQEISGADLFAYDMNELLKRNVSFFQQNALK
jgi:hypothetical protein